MKEELDWILPALRKELEDGGVTFHPEETRLGLHFSMRDLSWNARAKDPTGQTHRKSFAVSRWAPLADDRRRPLAAAEFHDRKKMIRKEAEDWIAKIRGD